MEVFDKVYNKKGKVQVFPDFVESKVNLYERVIPARPPPPAGAVRDAQSPRKQTTLSTATARSTGQTSNVSTDSQQQGEQKEATGSAESLGGTLQDKKTAAETQGLSSEGNIEASSGGKDGDSGDKTKTKKIRTKKDPKSYALNEDKLQNEQIAVQLESEYWEYRVVQLVKAALEGIMGPDDPTVFLFHNQDLSSKAGNSEAGNSKAGNSKAGNSKAGNSEAGNSKAGNREAGNSKAGNSKAGNSKAGNSKAGNSKAGNSEAGNSEAGNIKAGNSEAGNSKAGNSEAGNSEAGNSEAGNSEAGNSKAGNSKGGNSKAGNSKSCEKDILVLHPHLGVLVVEVKAVKNKDAFCRFGKGTDQLLHAKKSVLEEMGDLLEEDAVVLTIALPKMEPEDSTIIRQKTKERLSAKPGSDITAATSTFPVSSGGAGGDHDPKLKRGAELENHPDIHFVCGHTAEDFKQWVTRLQDLRATPSHAFKGCTPQERLENFKKACMRRCSVAGLRPGQSVKDRSDLHHRFLLTEEQLRVRDSQAELLHISGPCGSGKTLLLAERARRWLREGRRVALMVGDAIFHNVLLCHLVDSVCGDKSVAGVSTHIHYIDLLQWLDTLSTEDMPVSIVVDEAGFVFDPFSYYSRLLPHVTAGRVRGLWTARTGRVEDERELESLGGSTVHLSLCLRCPPHVRDWTDSLREEDEPPLLPPPVPIMRELGEGVQIICHPDHPQRQSWHTCTRCEEEVTAFFSSLGLLGDGTMSALKLSDVVVLTTGYRCDRKHVARWLRGLGLHAVMEEGKTWDYSTPVLPPGATPKSRDHAEQEAYRQRILKGNDVTGKPAVHVVLCVDFRGLEKPVVLLWHEDGEDEHRDKQGQWDREERMKRHRDHWFQAASRCQGRLLVMAATPSPLLPLLPATSPPDDALTRVPQESSTATASSSSGVTSASPAPPASHSFPVSSSSLGRESNPQLSSPPE